MGSGRFAGLLALVAVGCTSIEPTPPVDSGDASDDASDDAATDSAPTDGGRPVLSAAEATFSPSQLRASPSGLHFFANGTGTDFGGAAFSSANAAVVRASLDGKTQWNFPTCFLPGTGVLDANAAGDSIAVGSFPTTCVMGGATLTSGGDEDGAIARLDPTGKPKWVKRVGGIGVDRASAVRLDPSGNAIVAGTTGGVDDTSLQLGPLAGEFLAKLDADGGVAWFKQFNGAGYKLAMADGGDFVFFGSLLDGTDFGSGPIARPTDEALTFVAMKSDGTVKWTQVITFARIDGVTRTIPAVSDFAIDGDGNVWFATRFAGLVASIGKDTFTAPGSPLSLLVGKLDASGNPVFATMYPQGSEARFATGAGKAFMLTRTVDHAYVLAYAPDGSTAWRTDIGTGSAPTGLGFDGTNLRAIGTFTQPIVFSDRTLTGPGAFLLSWAP